MNQSLLRRPSRRPTTPVIAGLGLAATVTVLIAAALSGSNRGETSAPAGRLSPRVVPQRLRATRLIPTTVSAVENKPEPWQLAADTLIDIDATREQRVEAIRMLFSRRNDLVSTFQSAASAAVEGGRVNLTSAKDIIYPQGTEARRILDGLDAVRNQLVTDILPSLSTREGLISALPIPPSTTGASIEGGVGVAGGVGAGGLNVTGIVEGLKGFGKNPEELRANLHSAKEEAKNIFRRTPGGLEMPNFTVLAKGEGFEIREYDPYTIVSTPLKGGLEEDGRSVSESGKAFNTLASYLFGSNSDNQAMEMTAPVEMTVGPKGAQDMAFVLPSKYSTDTPLPSNDDDITIQKVPSQVVAVREFTGFATDGEIERQKAELVSALSVSNYAIENPEFFRVLQWNPPYTLPWVRRNEICTRVLPVAEVIEESKEDVQTEVVVEAGDAVTSSADGEEGEKGGDGGDGDVADGGEGGA